MATIRNLVFKGGGVRGIAYLGALKYLFEHGLMRSVERVAGTSVGAVTATVVALNFDAFDTIRQLSDSLEYRRIPAGDDEIPAAQEDSDVEEANLFQRLAAKARTTNVARRLQCSMRLVQEKGWYSSEYLYAWMREVIASQFSVKKDFYTFKDFHDASIHLANRKFFDLHLTGSDISNRTIRVFSFETTPDMEVALAVRISMSIPLFFESVPFQYPGTESTQLYADGGIMWNYPIGIFDDERHAKKLVKGLNEETLGFFLYTAPERTPKYREVKSLVDYVGALFESLLLVQEQLVLGSEKNIGRTIFIDDEGVPMTDFDISPGDEHYLKLFESGYAASAEYFSNRRNLDMFLHRIREAFGRRKNSW